MKKTSLATIGVALLLLSGCAAPTPTPTPTAGPTPTAAPITTVEELVGVWLQRWYLQFKEDGSYGAAASTEGLEDPYLEGEFWFEGGQLFLKDIAATEEVCVGLPAGRYEVQGAVKDYFILVAIDDPCETRAWQWTVMPFEWVSP